MIRRPILASTLTLLTVLALPSGSQAQQVVRVLAGTGAKDVYGLGFGAAAGIERPFIGGKPFFVGIRGLYHLGTEAELPNIVNSSGEPVVGSVRQFHFGIEIGSTWVQSPVIVRTVGGFGLARLRGAVDTGEGEVTEWREKFQYGPGVMVALPTEGGSFYGIEARWVKVLDMTDTFAIYATIGKKFF